MRHLRIITVILLTVVTALSAAAQPDRVNIRKGNRQFRKKAYQAADISYRKALMADSTSIAASYNLANNLYRQQNMDEAGKYLDRLKEKAPSSPYAADYYYNTGDVALQKKDYQAAVDAFRQSLLLNPSDLDAKENYIYARKMLENQQGRGGGDDQKDQKDNQDQQNQQDQNNQNNQDNQDNKDQQDNQNQQQPQPREGALTSQQAQQLLQAIQAKEKETQDKVNKEKAAALKSRQKDKNW
ncbi:MAG: tetratricopeptide repeat protein [Bacteroidales bacterium]|nr:tetratricopeptide repeat protein [Bacteroidales bacterium]